MFALGAVVPIDLRALAASTLGAYAVIAVIEGVITALIVRALLGVRPDLVRVAEPLRRRRQRTPRAAVAPRPGHGARRMDRADVTWLRRRRARRARPAHAARGARPRRGRRRRVGAQPGGRGDPRARASRRRAGRLRRPHPRRRASPSTRARRATACAWPACTPAIRRSTAPCTSRSTPAGDSGSATTSCPGSARWPAPRRPLGQELTVPDVSQTLILTRRATADLDAAQRAARRARAPRHDDGALPLGPPPARAAGRADRGRLRRRRRRAPSSTAPRGPTRSSCAAR